MTKIMQHWPRQHGKTLSLWKVVWASQGGRCFECARPTPLKNTAKHSCSFHLLCQDCYDNHKTKIYIAYSKFGKHLKHKIDQTVKVKC